MSLITVAQQAAGSDDAALLEFGARNAARGDPFEFGEAFESMSTKQRRQFWASVLGWLERLLAKAAGDEDAVVEGDADADAPSSNIKAVLPAMAQATCMLMAFVKIAEAPKDLQGPLLVARQLLEHNTFFSLQNYGPEGSDLQAQIASLGERWWKLDREGANLLSSTVMMYLLLKSLDTDTATLSDTKRVHGMRTALALIEWSDDSSDDMRDWLCACFVHPNYLKSDAGKSFLVFTFGLHPDFIAQLFKTIKGQVSSPGVRKSVLEAYGSVLFRAWRGTEAGSPYRQRIEEDAVQVLIEGATHARSGALFKAVRTVLGQFHAGKVHPGVDEMLARLYDPIMWRSLKAANPTVRLQATTLLFDTFPLTDPSAGAADVDAAMQRQITAITDAMFDADPRLRAAAAQGVCCKVLAEYWELLPAAARVGLLGRVVRDVCFDKAAPTVRMAALAGLEALLEQPLAHSTLAQLLPDLKPLLHDTNRGVRSSVVKLLQRVQRARTINFTDVVPLEELLLRLRCDGAVPAVAVPLAQLLLPIFFPPQADTAKLISTCAALMQIDSGAAIAFYRNVHAVAPASQVAKMVQLLYRCVASSMKHAAPAPAAAAAKGKKRKKGGKKDDDAESEGSGRHLTIADAPTLLQAMAALWRGVHPTLERPENEKARAKLAALLGAGAGGGKDKEALTELLAIFEAAEQNEGTDAARRAICAMAALLPPTSLPKLARSLLPEVLQQLAAATPADARAVVAHAAPAVDLLCAWGFEARLVTAVTESVQAAAGSKAGTPGTLAGAVALQLLQRVLASPALGPDARYRLFVGDKAEGLALLACLQQLLPTVEASLSKGADAAANEFAISAVAMYGRLCVHVADAGAVAPAEEAGDDDDEMADATVATNSMPQSLAGLLKWAAEHLTAASFAPGCATAPFALGLAAAILSTAADAAAVGKRGGQHAATVAEAAATLCRAASEADSAADDAGEDAAAVHTVAPHACRLQTFLGTDELFEAVLDANCSSAAGEEAVPGFKLSIGASVASNRGAGIPALIRRLTPQLIASASAAAADEDGDGAPLPPAVAPLLSPLCRSAASATEVARALLQRLRAVHEISTTDGDADNAGATEQGRAVLALMGAVLDAATTSKVRTAIALELQVGLKTVAQQLEAGAGAGAGAERCSSPLVPCITGLGALNTRVAGLTISTQ